MKVAFDWDEHDLQELIDTAAQRSLTLDRKQSDAPCQDLWQMNERTSITRYVQTMASILDFRVETIPLVA